MTLDAPAPAILPARRSEALNRRQTGPRASGRVAPCALPLTRGHAGTVLGPSDPAPQLQSGIRYEAF